jgi:hypothetical protein
MNHTRVTAALSSAFLGVLVCACGGGSGSLTSPSVPTGPPPAPILVNGATYQYSGSVTTTLAYTSPTPTQLNSSGAATYTDLVTVQPSAGGAPAPFDVQHVYQFTATQTPVYGVEPEQQTTDDYENQTFTGGSESLFLAGTKTATTGIDLSAGVRLGGGPFTDTATTTTTYTTPQTLGVYPLQTGAVLAEPLARTATGTTVDTNAGGTIGGGGPSTTTYQNDGSFTRTSTAAANGSVTNQTESGNGTGQSTQTFVTGNTTQDAIAVAQSAGGIFTIPVTVTTTAGGASMTNATDWYPGNGLPPAPLATTTRTVKGPIALPAACGFSGTAPAVTEIDVALGSLDVFGSLTVTSTRVFDAAGITVCRLQTSTTGSYALTTGALTETETTTQTETLTSSNQTIAGVRRTP